MGRPFSKLLPHWLISRSWAKNSLSTDREKGGLGTSWSNTQGDKSRCHHYLSYIRKLYIVEIWKCRPPYHFIVCFFLLWKSHGWFYPSYSTYSSAWATFSVLNEPTMLCELRICVTSGYMQICFEELDETFCLCWDNTNFKLYLISTNPRCPLSHCKVSASSKWISFGFDWKTPPEPAAIHDPNLELALI